MKNFIFVFLILFLCFKNHYQYKYYISIIIPVYKAEKYLYDCLNSLINQTLKNIQIICINDESPDNSIKILNQFSKQDKRITVKSIKHVSISETRNEGLKFVDGEYIGFVDDDDFIDLNQYEKMYEYAKKDNIDLLQIGYDFINENDKFPDIIKKNKLKYKDEKIIYNPDGDVFRILNNENWNKIYKTEIIKKNKIMFEPNCGGEDLNFNLRVYPFVKKFKKINTQSYFFRKKKNLLYLPIKYFFGSNKLFFKSLIEYYKQKNINKNNSILCFELMIIGYKQLFRNERYLYNKNYLKNFFLSFKKLNIEEDKIIKNISSELKRFYFDIHKKYKEFYIKEMNEYIILNFFFKLSI